MQRLIKPSRLLIFLAVFIVSMLIYVVELYKLQIIEGEAYYAKNESSQVTKVVAPAARGNILDRYGRVLVSNSACNNITIDTTDLFAQEDPNAVILQLIEATELYGDSYNDTLPITRDAPFEFTDMTYLQKSMLEAWLKANKMASDATAVEILSRMRSRYGISNSYSAAELRKIAGIRYEINNRFNINTTDYIFAENVGMGTLTYLMEQDVPGFDVTTSYVREYKTSYAPHLLGYTGLLTAEEWEQFADQDYSLDAYVGKDGVEYAFESYLHGVDGVAAVTTTVDGVLVGTEYEKEPQPGNHVYLTIDIGLQEVCEEALSSHIDEINAERALVNENAEKYGTESEEMISGGAAVVVDVNTGEPLALASWPGYNAATMLEDYEALVADENAPLYNRALMGVYAPGSTFKPCTSTALLAEKILSPTTTLLTKGQFTKYIDDGYAPECWIYSTYDGITHGEINVAQAITYSCNYFFYNYGDRLGIDRMARYAKMFGLGEKTGIELPEVTGQMATPSYKEQYEGIPWYNGDTLQAAIGQSYSEFTPLQMAEYCAALANFGERHSASILKEVRSYDYGNVLFERESEVLSRVEADDETFSTIKYGMWGVVYDQASTLTDIFLPLSVQVAAKTGTAQRGEGLKNNAMFICYAPYDEPEIAIAIAVEKGGAGATLAPLAAEIVDYYFRFKSSTNALEAEMTTLK